MPPSRLNTLRVQEANVGRNDPSDHKNGQRLRAPCTLPSRQTRRAISEEPLSERFGPHLSHERCRSTEVPDCLRAPFVGRLWMAATPSGRRNRIRSLASIPLGICPSAGTGPAR